LAQAKHFAQIKQSRIAELLCGALEI